MQPTDGIEQSFLRFSAMQARTTRVIDCFSFVTLYELLPDSGGRSAAEPHFGGAVTSSDITCTCFRLTDIVRMT